MLRRILNMTKEILSPQLGNLLRSVIKASGHRRHIDDIGLDKDLDDLALESRPSVVFELMQRIEDACGKELAADCGFDWAQSLKLAWFQTKSAIQALVQHVDTSPLSNDIGKAVLFRQFTVPMLSAFIRVCFTNHRGLDVDLWWKSPFAAWVQLASSQAGISSDDLVANLATHLSADQRTTERWMAGEPIGKICWPYRMKVLEAVGEEGQGQLKHKDIDQLAGWLLLAVSFQSLTPAVRDAVMRDFSLRSQEPWILAEAASAIGQQCFKHGNNQLRSVAVPILERIEQLFSETPRDFSALQAQLNSFQELIQRAPETSRFSYQYIHDWFSARLAALQGHQDDALRLYMAAVSGAWWCAGPNQHPILNEALLYAVGVGDKVKAENYWDKTFVLGLNAGPKRTLDEQELRRIAFGFEKMFSPQKAKDRIPPPEEIIVQDGDFTVTPKQLASPNQKAKFAEGRTRRTPLMEAIRDGTLDDVKCLLDAGGNPNDFIKESGEGPLSYAMRRACDRKDPSIMEHLLGLDLLSETVNRPASTKRETPMKIAIEMANASAVTRLVSLGADVEKPCDYLPSALCYAMVLFHGSLHRDDPTQELGYLLGKGRADVYDAKDGAVLDVDLAARRQNLLAMRNASQRNRQMFEAVMDYFIRPAVDYREVIKALINGGANANRRYRVQAQDLDEWTPTLFAAEVGDLEVFKMLVEHRGNNAGRPDLVLRTSSSLERFDALWIAIAYGRHAIVNYLVDKLR